MKSLIVRSTIFGIITAFLLGPTQAADKKSPGLLGNWTGKGIQFEDGTKDEGQYSTWDISVTFGPSSVTIGYPSLNCGGVWQQEQSRPNATYYRETITFGLENCIDQGLVVTSPMDDGRLRVEYYYPDDVFIAIGYVSKGK